MNQKRATRLAAGLALGIGLGAAFSRIDTDRDA